MHGKALVDTVEDTLAETKAVILGITKSDIVVEVLAERLAVTLTKAECLVETPSDAVTDSPGCTAEALVNTFVALLVKKEGQNTLGHNERCANVETLGHRRRCATSSRLMNT